MKPEKFKTLLLACIVVIFSALTGGCVTMSLISQVPAGEKPTAGNP